MRSWLPGVRISDAVGVQPRKLEGINLRPGSHVVLQLRDLLNWYASLVVNSYDLMQRGRYYKNEEQLIYGLRHEIQVYRVIMCEYRGLTDFIKYPRVVYVFYDDFVQSEDRRREICTRLSGVYSEVRLDKVPRNGGGSSFDKVEFDRNGQEMSVLTRYKQVPAKLLKYFQLLQDSDIMEEYVGWRPFSASQEEFLNKIHQYT
jgi:hypothetical protein